MQFSAGFGRIIGCIATQHDLRLVGLAVVICLLSCFTAYSLIQRAMEAVGRPAWPWQAAAAGVFGGGVWATHFVGELAYAPGLPIGFDVGWTMLSLLIVAAISAAGLQLGLRRNAALGGAILGLAVVALHFTGMQAVQVPADIGWDLPLVVAAVAWALSLGALALRVLLHRPTLRCLLGGTLLQVAATCGLHFAAMAALRLEPNPLLPSPEPLAYGDWLPMAIGAVVAVMVLGGRAAVLFDLRQAKADFQAAYALLAAALETMPAGIALFDRADRLVALNGTYARIHPKIAHILKPGTSFESILRQNVRHSRFDLGDEAEAYIARRLAQHHRPGEPFERRLNDGRWERVSEQRMADGGLSLVISDITREKEREAALLAARNAAEAANRAKSAFLANMSHELRTPLNAIIGFSEAMTSGLFGPIGSPRYAEYAKDIHRSGRYLHALISDMLDMAKIEAGHRELEREPVDCTSEIEEALAMLRPRAEQGGVRLVLQQSGAIGTLNADRRAFKQILLNLIGNAVKFTPAAGSVTVRLSESGHDGVLQVVDTGIGIAAGDLPQLGTPFFRASQRPSAVEGTGLGLALTRALVELHGWHMQITSEPGRGTTVSITMSGAMTPPPAYAAAS